MKTTVLTREQAVQRRDAALAVLGLTLEEWQKRKADEECSCCVAEEMRRDFAYGRDNGWQMIAAIDQVRDMEYLLGEDS